ncbi:hypothetical protein [Halococcus salifodinae]|uniref:hypothetical protein n=1 Tax=Halococcus salifodinae TaxID=36738 RepID=UPI003F842D41
MYEIFEPLAESELLKDGTNWPKRPMVRSTIVRTTEWMMNQIEKRKEAIAGFSVVNSATACILPEPPAMEAWLR